MTACAHEAGPFDRQLVDRRGGHQLRAGRTEADDHDPAATPPGRVGHGVDTDPIVLSGRRIYIVPTRLGLAFAVMVFAMFLGCEMGLGPSIAAGASAGLCWVAASFAINYLFERRPLSLWLINGGYHTLQFTLFGLILGAMN